MAIKQVMMTYFTEDGKKIQFTRKMSDELIAELINNEYEDDDGE